LPDGETRSELSEEEVRPDGTRVVRHVVTSQSDGVAPAQQADWMKSVRAQLEQAAAVSPEAADEIFQALGELESGGATVKVVRQSQVVSGSELSGPPVGTPSPMAVQWNDGQRYPCSVVERKGDQCLVEFGDGSRRWVPAAALVSRS